MRTTALLLAALLGLPGVAAAQASVDIHFDIPVVLPRLVVVSPGVQVVPECREEVFFHDGWYWVRRDSSWYRSRDHRGGWVMVPARGVPPRLAAFPPGHYRNWKAEKEERKAERKAERRAEKRHERWEREREHERRDDRREYRRDDRRDDDRGGPPGRGEGHGRGRGRD
jgi:hypothetical protein